MENERRAVRSSVLDMPSSHPAIREGLQGGRYTGRITIFAAENEQIAFLWLLYIPADYGCAFGLVCMALNVLTAPPFVDWRTYTLAEALGVSDLSSLLRR
jgi:hypothetical protein